MQRQLAADAHALHESLQLLHLLLLLGSHRHACCGGCLLGVWQRQHLAAAAAAALLQPAPAPARPHHLQAIQHLELGQGTQEPAQRLGQRLLLLALLLHGLLLLLHAGVACQ